MASRLDWNLYGGYQWKAYDAPREGTGTPTSTRAVSAGQLPAPPAFDEGFSALYVGMDVGMDTRGQRLRTAAHVPSEFEHRSGTGVALGARFRLHEGLRSTQAAEGYARAVPRWIDYSGSVEGTLDLTGTQRRLEVELVAAFADPLPDAGAVPFSEQIWLGGPHPLRGFRDHRLLDRSATVATLTYRWPVWTYLDGNIHYAVGNVFGAHLAGFDTRLLRSSFGIGVSSASPNDNPFEALLAFGTQPFDYGGNVESVRVVFGTGAGL
jgi:hypothetical protein